MKVMVMVKASQSSEAGKMPSQALLQAMGEFNETLVKAGIMEAGDGLKPSREGVRVRFDGRERTVTKGPFAETNELVAGYWVWQVSSMEEAIAWVKKCPNPMEEASEIEIRPYFEMDDFAEIDKDGSVREHEDQLRQTLSMRQAKTNCYLFFSGRCDEALEYYQKHLGARVGLKFRFNESPDPVPAGMLPPGFEEKVMHCEFSIGDMKIFASDGCGDEGPFTGFNLALTIDSEAEAHRVFDALADGGAVRMPLEKTFWSPLYGQVTDKFGIGWMVMLPGSDNGEQ
ncbi:YciI family protein [Photobacterium galatheae]|uniref:Transcription initiation protein n=1 Tax=Photobacterium galatheae TaxID=1654360 RepID=A0A066RWA2_9GAMM|nr:YciI family protein [Photobacterium galatheae]KDM91648.1 transcription initiation protein [Photobacterium galatheae]MCM0149723.1 VOC family protein [Photobacterium galatheae]